jgi:hypothetical protein
VDSGAEGRSVTEERYARGGVVHGPGEGIPIRFDPTREQIMTAAQAAARAREVLQAVRDATPDYTHFRYVGDTPDGTSLYEEAEPPRPNYCYYCHQPIRIMINRGTGWCSEQCRKRLAGEWDSGD